MNKRFLLKLFLCVGLVISVALVLPHLDVRASSPLTITHTSKDDFVGGNLSDTLDIDTTPGKMKLTQDKHTYVSDLEAGFSPEEDVVLSDQVLSLGFDYGYDINRNTTPGLGSDTVYHSFLDPSNGYLYISTHAGGVAGGVTVIDTNSNTLVARYDSNSIPEMDNNTASTATHSFLDVSSGYLYISVQYNGLFVIDTETHTLVTRYYTGSTPALAHDNVRHSFMDPDTSYLYVSTNGGGLSVIDTNTDTLVTRYHTGSTPALADNSVYHSFLDSDTGHLYASTFNGLSVIDTNTDTLVTRYHTGSTPALASNRVRHSFLDSSNGYLYISMGGLYGGGGLSVIDTISNTLVTRYHAGSTPAIHSGVEHSFLDNSNGYLYISTGGSGNNGGLSVIDTTNNTLVARYDTDSIPALGNDLVYHSFLDSETGYLYVGAYHGGLSVIKTDPVYHQEGEYFSENIFLNQPWQGISVGKIIEDYGEVNVRYKTGHAVTAWFDGFEDADSYAGNYYGWGGHFIILWPKMVLLSCRTQITSGVGLHGLTLENQKIVYPPG